MENDYFKGLSHYLAGDYEYAIQFFINALNKNSIDHHYYTLCLSYYGLTLIHSGDYEIGITKCKEAAQHEVTNSEIFYNLALGARIKKDRKLSLKAIRDGLRLERNNKKLIRLRKVLGERRKPKVLFLHRNNIINILLGKLTYQNQ